MKNGTILLWRYLPGADKWTDLFMRLICYFTDSDYVHAEIYFDGYTYGMNETVTKYAGVKNFHEAWEPVVDMTLDEQERMRTWLETSVDEQWIYDRPKVVFLAIVYNTRWFWKRMKWEPFRRGLPSEVCSAYCDQAWMSAGRDILPGQHEWYTAPCDFARSSALQMI